MAKTNVPIRGLDGAWYYDTNELKAADARYEQQEQQNKLIEEQNQLMEKQMRENRQQELKNMIKQQELEISRQEHEKEMRLSRLCDKVGINKKLMDEFIEYLFNKKSKNKEETQELEMLYNKYAKYQENLFDLEVKERGVKRKEEQIAILNEIKNNNFKREDKIQDSRLKNDIEAYEKFGGIIAVGFMCAFCITMLAIIFSSLSILYLNIISIIIIAFGGILLIIAKKSIRTDVEKSINKILNDKTYDKDISDKISKLKKENENDENKYFKLWESCVQTKVDDFYDFRLKHYNAQLEKLLYDFELPKKMEFNKIIYKSVNKNIAENNGDIEDYVAYFESIND